MTHNIFVNCTISCDKIEGITISGSKMVNEAITNKRREIKRLFINFSRQNQELKE